MTLQGTNSSRAGLRIELGGLVRLGPGKVRLLEVIAELGSISAAGRAMDISYRRAWVLIDELNRAFREPVVVTKPGGLPDQRAAITPFGRQVIRRYRIMEAAAHVAIADDLAIMTAFLRKDTSVAALPDPSLKP